jgi:hypothetical protein
MLVCMLAGCGMTVPRPEIKEAEFDITVTYEWNGEQKTVSGVYVCEYDGTSWALDGGYSRAWKGYLKDGAEDVIEIGTTENGDWVSLHLALCSEYFMDDFVEGHHNVPVPYISVTVENDEGMQILHEPKDVEDYCGAKIISYSYDEPIENEFGLLK